MLAIEASKLEPSRWSAFRDWRKERLVVATWLALYFISTTTALLGKVGMGLAIIMTGALPFILGFVVLGRIVGGRIAVKLWDGWYAKGIWVVAVFVYGLYAKKWAGDVVNELFGVDARFFGNTTGLLAVLFAPFGLLYRKEVIELVVWCGIAVSLIGLPLHVAWLAFWPGLTSRSKHLLSMLFWWGAFLIYLMSMPLWALAFRPAIVNFALWADFNETHLCVDPWIFAADRVVFLDNGLVLAHMTFGGERFETKSCNYQRGFGVNGAAN